MVTPPPYRNDFMHAVDVVEEIAIGRGLGSFEPELPDEFTPGHLTAQTRFGRAARDVLVGLGYQEMIFNYLGARRDYTERMNAPDRVLVEVANPMTENYAVVRDSVIPCLLAAEMSSQNAAYPHHMFEVGKVALPDGADPTGSRTVDTCTLLVADRAAGFNDRPPPTSPRCCSTSAPSTAWSNWTTRASSPGAPPASRRPHPAAAGSAANGGERTWTAIGVAWRTAPRRAGALVDRHALRRRRTRPRHPPHHPAGRLTAARAAVCDLAEPSS